MLLLLFERKLKNNNIIVRIFIYLLEIKHILKSLIYSNKIKK